MSLAQRRRRRWTRVEYERAIDRGIFTTADRIELLDGVLVAREPQGDRHAATVAAVHLVLQRAFGPRYHVRVGAPVALDPMSEPEPDLAVVRGKPFDYRTGHPARPVLMVEVSESSLARDRLRKSGLYARAGIGEYWVLNLVHGALEIHREPVRAPGRRYGWKYASVRVLGRNVTVAPLARPRSPIRVADLLG